MKLLSLFLLQFAAADKCLICDYVGTATTEAYAISMLSGSSDKAPICATVTKADFDPYAGNGQYAKIQYSTVSDKSYCIAQFFIYYAKDINKYVYGVKRTASDSTVTAGRVDVEGFDGVKGYQYALARDGDVDANRIWGRKYARAATLDLTLTTRHTDTDDFLQTYGGNPIFKERAMYYGKCAAATITGTSCSASITDTDAADTFSFPYIHAGTKSTGTCTGTEVAQCDKLVAYTADATAPTTSTATCILVSAASKGDCTAATQVLFMGDGREDEPASTVTAVSTTTLQEQAYTRCLVCHGSQEFQTPPSAANQITNPCWNPSGSSTFATTDLATMDPRQYCQPANGLCSTTTWQYSTKDKAGTTSSHWVGVQRGCSDASTSQTSPSFVAAGNTYNFKRGLSTTTAYVRYHAATNTASKAKDNAKYPDADVATKIPVAIGGDNSDDAAGTYADGKAGLEDTGTAGTSYAELGAYPELLVALVPQFMSVDGNGKPDIPTTVLVNELECISCVTPIRNTDASNNCVTAKASGRVMCKTLSCQATTATFRLGADGTDTYYYSKRGCTADPEDGVTEGEQDPADAAVTPEGWTGIKQYNQRSTTATGNTQRTSTVSVAKVFDCYSCESHFDSTVSGSDAVEPKYDTIKSKDTSLCWETFEPQTDSSVSSTGTSGSCIGNCFASAYKYKETMGTAKNPSTTYHWYVKRGCATDTSTISTGSTPSSEIYGVTLTNYACTFQNGTLCNGQIKAYDTTLEISTQNVRKLQCYECETAAGNADPLDPCYTIVSTAKATECADLSYTSCYATETAFNSSATTSNLGMQRGCAKGKPDSSSVAVEGYTNVMAGSTYCTSSSCNKGAGKTTGLTVAVASTPVVDPVDDTDAVDGSDAKLLLASSFLVFFTMFIM